MSEILVAGAVGGREHALGLELIDGGRNSITFTHGGNAGTQEVGTTLVSHDNHTIAQYALAHECFVVVGPEAPLVSGLADQTRSLGLDTFGPGADGAQLEASKAYGAKFCTDYGIPQPDYAVVTTCEEADGFLRVHSMWPETFVIKADGLTGGKGVFLPKSQQEAIYITRAIMNGSLFGDAGKTVVFQKRLNPAGQEISAMFLIDGQNFTLLPLVQDYKRQLDGNKGPNTGGMGSRTALDFENPKLIDKLLAMGDSATQGFRHRGIDYRGVLFMGVMLDAEDGYEPKALEFNVRFGDPETQVVLPELRQMGHDIPELLRSVARGSLDPSLRGTYLGSGLGRVAVCLASENYPGKPVIDREIFGLDKEYEGVTVYHGGTKFDVDSSRVITSGGRVLYVAAATKEEANLAIGRQGIHFEGMQHRKDIGDQIA